MPFAVRIDPHLRDQRRCIKVYLVLCDILPACQTADFPYLMPAFSRPELFFHVCFGKSSAFVAFLPACLTPGLFPSIISIGRPACLLIGRGRIRSVGTVIVNNALKPFVVVT